MIKVYDNILDSEEITFLRNTFLNKNCPYYLKKNQTDDDNRFNFTHVLQDRDTLEITSPEYWNVLKIIKNLCKKTNVKLKKTLRAAVNLTFPYIPSEGSIHTDHSFNHKQFIICLTDGGATNFFNNKNKIIKEVVSKKYRVLLFDKIPHAIVHSKKQERFIVVVTFV